MNDNRCLYCNNIIPEGRQVCPTCEKKLNAVKARRRIGYANSQIRQFMQEVRRGDYNIKK